MRIVCEQCGKDIATPQCKKYCNEKIKEKQLEKLADQLSELEHFAPNL